MKHINRKIISLIVMVAVMLMITPATVVQAAGTKLTAQNFSGEYYCSDYFSHLDDWDPITKKTSIFMEIGQSVDVSNLIFVKTNKKETPLTYCKSVSGFKATSKNKEVVRIRDGKVVAVGEGKTVVVVRKNNQKFTFQIEVRTPNYSISSDYKWINQYINTLSRKYPNEAAAKKSSSTFIKNMINLSSRIVRFENGIARSEECIDESPEYPVPYVYLSGVLGADAAYFLGIENPKEYFRLCELARECIKEKANKARDLEIEGVEVEKVSEGKGHSRLSTNGYKVTIRLKERITFNQCMKSYAAYNPYISSGKGVLSDLCVGKDLYLRCSGRLYKINNAGKESIYDNVVIEEKCKEDYVDVWIQATPGKYKLYFDFASESETNKYAVEFTLE